MGAYGHKKTLRILCLALVIVLSCAGLAGCGDSVSKAVTEAVSDAVQNIVQPDDGADDADDEIIGGADEPTTIVVTDRGSDTEAPELTAGDDEDSAGAYVEYRFRNAKLLKQHYEKHGIDMGFDSPEEYEAAASDVVNDPAALHKTEKDDGDDIYYIESTNEFVVVSGDGYLRTYFLPDAGKRYFDKQ